MKKTSEAKIKAIRKYDNAKYDKITIRLPKGHKEKIYKLGYSINDYVNEAVQQRMDAEEK